MQKHISYGCCVERFWKCIQDTDTVGSQLAMAVWSGWLATGHWLSWDNQLGLRHMTKVLHPSYWYQNLIPETWKQFSHMIYSVEASGTRQVSKQVRVFV